MGAYPTNTRGMAGGFEQAEKLQQLGDAFQRGTTTLVAGTVTVNATLTAGSVIMATRRTKAGAVAHGLIEVPAASRNIGAGTFVINAISEAAGAVVAADVSTVDWLVIG